MAEHILLAFYARQHIGYNFEQRSNKEIIAQTNKKIAPTQGLEPVVPGQHLVVLDQRPLVQKTQAAYRPSPTNFRGRAPTRQCASPRP